MYFRTRHGIRNAEKHNKCQVNLDIMHKILAVMRGLLLGQVTFAGNDMSEAGSHN